MDMNTPMTCEFCRYYTQYTYGRQCDNARSKQCGKRMGLHETCEKWEERIPDGDD